MSAADGGGVSSTGVVEYDGRPWPRNGAARGEFERALSERLHAEYKSTVARLEQELRDAHVRWQSDARWPEDHRSKVVALIIDELRADARREVGAVWKAYAGAGTAEALDALCDTLKTLREREVLEIGPNTGSVVVEALARSVRPGTATLGDVAISSAYAAVKCAAKGLKLGLRDALGGLERALLGA